MHGGARIDRFWSQVILGQQSEGSFAQFRLEEVLIQLHPTVPRSMEAGENFIHAFRQGLFLGCEMLDPNVNLDRELGSVVGRACFIALQEQSPGEERGAGKLCHTGQHLPSSFTAKDCCQMELPSFESGALIFTAGRSVPHYS